MRNFKKVEKKLKLKIKNLIENMHDIIVKLEKIKQTKWVLNYNLI